jgi:P27 family predicted phage terminase small subunit
MPAPPEHLNAAAIAEWNRIVPGLTALRLLHPNYRAPLAAYCAAYSRWVQAERALAAMGAKDLLTGGLMIKTSNGNAIQNPLVGTANKAAADMVRYATEFGMTPSAQARIEMGPAPTASKWAGLIGGTQAG